MIRFYTILSIFTALIWSCTDKSAETFNSIVTSSVQSYPVVLTTWANVGANEKAYDIMAKGGSALDGIEQGIRVTESDTTDQSVGVGGLPDASGIVTLDACIMDYKGDAGSVTYLKDIDHPISVARLVMEELDHVMLTGEGAREFAINHGFTPVNLLTPTAAKAYKDWQEKNKPGNNHDTIGMIVIDKDGHIGGGCSTSGMAYKVPGRVGDSPIIGAGLFIDDEVGGATATGVGEEVMKTLGSFLIVELMRQGKTPQQACEEAVQRLIYKKGKVDFQVGYIAINKQGEIGAYAVQPGFEYALTRNNMTKVEKSKSYY
jgi:N4-(beta-N-acetylglucosaminyl)-L-asparaginase